MIHNPHDFDGSDDDNSRRAPMSISPGRPRVLLVADKFGYPDGVVMGVGTYILNVAPALAKAGIYLHTCILRDPHTAAEPLNESGQRPEFLGASRANVFVAFRLAALARQHECTVLHATGIKASLMARIASRLTGIPVALHIHDQMRLGFLLSRLHRAAAQPHDMGLCVSHAVKDAAVRGYHLSEARLKVIPNGIRLGAFRRAPTAQRFRVRESLGVDSTQPVLGMFARMYPVKGHRAMLDMMPEIVSNCPNVLLLLAGDGPERRDLEAQVQRLSIAPNVRFLGHREDIPELLAAIDLFLLPSKTEGLPIAGIEAMAAGRAIVGFDVGGMSEMVDHGLTGLLVPFGHKSAFSGAVCDLILNPTRLHAFSARASQAAERFSVEEHVKQLIEYYEELSETCSR